MQESNNIIPPTTTSLGLAEALLGVSVTRLPNGNYEVGPEFDSCIIEAREIVRIYTADANDVFRRIEQWMTASRVCDCANQHEAVPCESCALHDLLMSASILLAEQRRD